MKKIDINQKVRDLNVKLPDIESFWRLGDLTALRQNSEGKYYRANYERGILLYALVAHFKPTTILEFGTGRGYGSFCMARSLVDHNLPGKIYTVDKRSKNKKEVWPINLGKGEETQNLSWEEVWTSRIDKSWLDRIQLLTGDTPAVLSKWKKMGNPNVDFSFIDAGHDYDSVKHDYYSVLDIASSQFAVLFDDYVPKPGFGIQKLIDEEVEPVFNAECVVTDRRWNASAASSLVAENGMVLISTRDKKPAAEGPVSSEKRSQFLSTYRKKRALVSLIKNPLRKLVGR
jgi:predicted O-methyltransferase YrrM